jgi:hydroxypyruvate reductase
LAARTGSRPDDADRAAGGRDDPRSFLLDCYGAALAAVDGRRCVRRELERQRLTGEWAVIGVGKAAGAMALGAAEFFGARLVGGLVVVPPDHVAPGLAQRAPSLRVIESAHPLPDTRSLAAGAAMLEFVADLSAHANVLCQVSGGASSLVEALRPGITLDDLRCVNHWVLGSGAPIAVVNALRRRLSLLKGGGLAVRLGSRRAVALMISDVPGDDPATIGSGLLHVNDAKDEPDLRQLAVPAEVASILQRAGDAGARHDVPRLPVTVIATVSAACRAAARHARAAGVPVRVATRRFDGEAQRRGAEFAHRIAAAVGPVLHVQGGETTVTLPPAPGRGGRNQHLALAAALELERSAARDVWLLAAGTDGVDGNSADAGAIVDAGTCDRARDAGYDPHVSLARADSGTLLEGAGDLLHTGPTLTNVGDLVLALRH